MIKASPDLTKVLSKLTDLRRDTWLLFFIIEYIASMLKTQSNLIVSKHNYTIYLSICLLISAKRGNDSPSLVTLSKNIFSGLTQ